MIYLDYIASLKEWPFQKTQREMIFFPRAFKYEITYGNNIWISFSSCYFIDPWNA